MWRSARRAEFEERVRDHLTDALRLAQQLTSNPDEAEDVVQTALLRASRGWRSFRGECEFKTWLFRIVINVHRDALRKSSRDTQSLPATILDQRQQDPCAETMSREFEEQVASCVMRLPPRQREVLILATYDDLPTDEIANLLNISTSNVYATLHLARTRLRELLQPFVAETFVDD